ncbi:hypothetical protein HZC31_01195 [Candidatus Woesearchaeota archaeon]|nr:hypothetical protein [Candidatus Woesearchaeota archaeon]
MTETTALVRLSDIVDYQGDPRDAYQAVVSGLERGTIITSLSSWEDVGCIQYAVATNSQAWYAHLEAQDNPAVIEEALILRQLLLDAALEMMITSVDGVDPHDLLQLLTEKVATDRFYGTPIGRNFEQSVERCLQEGAPVDADAVALLRLKLRESARAVPQNHILAHYVADKFVAGYQSRYSAL